MGCDLAPSPIHRETSAVSSARLPSVFRTGKLGKLYPANLELPSIGWQRFIRNSLKAGGLTVPNGAPGREKPVAQGAGGN